MFLIFKIIFVFFKSCFLCFARFIPLKSAKSETQKVEGKHFSFFLKERNPSSKLDLRDLSPVFEDFSSS